MINIKDPNIHKPKSYDEWCEYYEIKTGEKVEQPQGFVTYFLEDRGFAQYKADFDGSVLFIYQVTGDGRFWRDVGELLCSINGLKAIVTITPRNIKPYLRLFGFKITQELEKDNQKRFICKDNQGRDVIATHYGTAFMGKPMYTVTQYIKGESELQNGW